MPNHDNYYKKQDFWLISTTSVYLVHDNHIYTTYQWNEKHKNFMITSGIILSELEISSFPNNSKSTSHTQQNTNITLKFASVSQSLN